MSIESAKKFLERMQADETFAKKVMACKDAETRMAFVKEAGFDFTAAEVSALKGELSDEDLDALAGGGWICWEGGRCAEFRS